MRRQIQPRFLSLSPPSGRVGGGVSVVLVLNLLFVRFLGFGLNVVLFLARGVVVGGGGSACRDVSMEFGVRQYQDMTTKSP